MRKTTITRKPVRIVDIDSITKTLTQRLKLCYTAPSNQKQKILVGIMYSMFNSEIENWISDKIVKQIIKLYSDNVFHTNSFSMPEKWGFVQLIHEFFIRFLIQILNKRPEIIIKNIDDKFIVTLINALNSTNNEEQKYLSNILHILDNFLVSKRSIIRQTVYNCLFLVVYDRTQQNHNGISFLLEFIGNIIDDFSIPLQNEDKKILCTVLLPLLKLETLDQFLDDLIICFESFIQKDISLSSVIIGGILKFYPSFPCKRQSQFISALDNILEITESETILKFIKPLFKLIISAVCSIHCKVSMAALNLLQTNKDIQSHLDFHRDIIFPIILPSLLQNADNHWNANIRLYSLLLIYYFQDLDCDLYLKSTSITNDIYNKKLNNKMKWKKIHLMASQN